MSPAEPPPAEPPAREPSREASEAAAGAAFWGFSAVSLGAAVHVALADPPTSGRAIAHVLYAAFHPLVLGAVLAGALALAAPRLRARPRWMRAIAAIVASVLAAASVVPDELTGFAARVAPGFEIAVVSAGTLAFGLLAPLAWIVGTPLRRAPLRWLGLALAAVAGIVEPRVLGGLYAGLHLYGLWLAGVFGASAMCGTRVVLPARVRYLAAAGAVVGALASVLIPAPLSVRSSLARDGGFLLPMLPWPAPPPGDRPTPDYWTRPESQRRPAPASVLERPVANPVVVLITIDCMRADVLDRRDTRGQLPTLTRMAERGVYFADAHAPGSMTVVTLTSVFTGTMYSQQRWEESVGPPGLWPRADRHVHFPQLLQDAGVHTVNIPGTNWLVADYGIVRGFEIEQYRPPSRPAEGNNRWIHSVDAVPRLIEALGALEPNQPAFLYAHFMDPHSPYIMGGRLETPFESYVAELARVDGQLARLTSYLERSRLAERTYLFVTADHGEGFREHGRREHAYGLYEELIQVPLLVTGPGLTPRRDETLVSLTDLGPTILDLFGQPTPGQFVGQSLLPLMLGQPAELTRPVLAETALIRSLVRPDGIKVIRDLRRGTLELYDLSADPAERHDRVDEMTPAMREAVGALDAYYEIHQLREGGYEPPLRR